MPGSEHRQHRANCELSDEFDYRTYPASVAGWQKFTHKMSPY